MVLNGSFYNRKNFIAIRIMGLIDCASSLVNFKIYGKGNPLVFLHGYLESMEIYRDFLPFFSNDYKTICIDLPGHGKSTVNFNMATMEDMAFAVKEVLVCNKVEKCVLVGHSMGGYVALAFAELYPEMLDGIVLLHSHPNADTLEKVNSRIIDVERIEMCMKSDIVEATIPRLFADENVDRFAQWVLESKRIATNTSNLGVIAALRGMAARKDRNMVIENLLAPILMIFGNKDSLIPYDQAQLLEKKHEKAKTIWLENSGHMGFIEEKDQAARAITSFLTELFERD